MLMSMRVVEAKNYFEKRNAIAYEYIDFFESLGYIVYLIPNNTNNINVYFQDTIDLIVLTGGNNINPKLYNNKDKLTDVYDERDNLERTIVTLGIENDIPILGICRGLQFLNTYFGGALSHGLTEHINTKHMLESKYENLNNVESNSYHSQGVTVDNLSKELVVIAVVNHYVESFRHNHYPILAVQWHPERQNKQYDKELIIEFVNKEKK